MLFFLLCYRCSGMSRPISSGAPSVEAEPATLSLGRIAHSQGAYPACVPNAARQNDAFSC
jgi:hypothetical protein